jgi:hypothetical protein
MNWLLVAVFIFANTIDSFSAQQIIPTSIRIDNTKIAGQTEEIWCEYCGCIFSPISPSD